VPLLNYTLAFAIQLSKSTGNLSQGSRVATRLLVAPTWLSFEGGEPGLSGTRYIGWRGAKSEGKEGQSGRVKQRPSRSSEETPSRCRKRGG
jgi:hypothetical protein